jgi:tetrahydromethanopterin S-methyltransferase subunit G
MTSEHRKPQTGKQLLLRFAEGSDLRDRLDQIARANGRSTTAEVLLRLEASLGDDIGVPDFVTGNRVDKLEKEIESLRAEVRALAAKMQR